ncbi:MAG TPA: hypothetical protein VHW69_05825 [Rhizomicrobium sp.]|nr:hypothetical protein [Rhizomicrobium sp.]
MQFPVGALDPKLDIETAALPGRFDGGADLRCIVDEHELEPLLKIRRCVVRIEPEQNRKLRAERPLFRRQVQFKRADAAGGLGQPQALLQI